MKKFAFFAKFRDAVVVVDGRGGVVYKNKSFERHFKDFTDLKKFSHNMNFELCPLNSENPESWSPIFHALQSKEEFSARIIYENPLKYYDLNTIKRKNYTALIFHDVTSRTASENLVKQNEQLAQECEKLEKENKDLKKIRQKAQSQAIRIAMANNISNSIRESMDSEQILSSARKKISAMLCA